MTTYLELPQNITIDGIVHCQCWRSKTLAIYQNYSGTTPPSNNPIAEPGGQIEGQNLFHLYAVEQLNPGEQLGEKLGTYGNLSAAMDRAVKEGIVA